jgi:3-phenylpropionate/trans-cinnamate dioxygenase ferredoxin reductase subunit
MKHCAPAIRSSSRAAIAARFPHPLFNGRRIRLEAWRNAQDQGALAARNMLGAEEPYSTLPGSGRISTSCPADRRAPGRGVDTIPRDLGDGARMFFTAR